VIYVAVFMAVFITTFPVQVLQFHNLDFIIGAIEQGVLRGV